LSSPSAGPRVEILPPAARDPDEPSGPDVVLDDEERDNLTNFSRWPLSGDPPHAVSSFFALPLIVLPLGIFVLLMLVVVLPVGRRLLTSPRSRPNARSNHRADAATGDESHLR
jgi:hypothetical protein